MFTDILSDIENPFRLTPVVKQGGDTAEIIHRAAKVVCVQTASLPFGSLTPSIYITEKFGIFRIKNGNFFEKLRNFVGLHKNQLLFSCNMIYFLSNSLALVSRYSTFLKLMLYFLARADIDNLLSDKK